MRVIALVKDRRKKRKKERKTHFVHLVDETFGLALSLVFNPRVVSIGEEIFANYRDRTVNILLEYWILLRIGYPLWILRVGGTGLDNHFQPSLSLSLSLGR